MYNFGGMNNFEDDKEVNAVLLYCLRPFQIYQKASPTGSDRVTFYLLSVFNWLQKPIAGLERMKASGS